jgi:peptide/nickel transport system substrate-binding protein
MKSLLQSFFSFLKKQKFPTKEQLIEIKDRPSSFYKWSVLGVCVIVVGLFLSLLLSISNHFAVDIPDYGGTLSEGVIGAPRFINPLLAASETDLALTKIVFSGLIKESDDGTLIPVLADHFSVSPDGKEYKFTLKDKLTFSNKKPLTSSDVLFTFNTKKRLTLNSDDAKDWSDISIEIPSSNTIVMRTSGDPTAFKEKLSLGIIPEILWKNITDEEIKDSTLNTSPIGAGPFIIKNITYTDTIPSEIVLKRNPFFTGPKAYIKTIKMHIFANQLDLKDGLVSKDIDSTSMLSNSFIDDSIKNDFLIQQIPTTKDISLFANSVGQTSTAGVALSIINPSIDRTRIIDTIENGYSIPSFSSGRISTSDRSESISSLVKLGYKQNDSGTLTKSGTPITVAIVVRKDDSLLKTAQELSEELASYGILTELKVFDQGLFIDQVSQGNYSFILGTTAEMPSGYKSIIPLYTKTFSQIKTENTHTTGPAVTQERVEVFRDIEKWYVQTDKIWKIK